MGEGIDCGSYLVLSVHTRRRETQSLLEASKTRQSFVVGSRNVQNRVNHTTAAACGSCLMEYGPSVVVVW